MKRKEALAVAALEAMPELALNPTLIAELIELSQAIKPDGSTASGKG